MPDVDLNFLAEQLARVLVELREMRGQTSQIPEMRADLGVLKRDVSELQIALAATRTDVGVIKETLEQVHKTQANHGARLNAIDGRLAIIEERTGLVKA